MEVTLKVLARSESGKGAARKSRAIGVVPAVLYGRGMEAIPVSVDAKDLSRALHTEAGFNVLINLQLDSKTKYLTMLREVQRNPVRGHVLHVDFLKIDRDVKIQADVPIHLVGESRGVKEGGIVENHLFEVKIECLPTNVPPNLEVDISDLGIGDHVRVSDIKVPEDVDILTPVEEMVASVIEPRLHLEEEVPAAEVAEGEALEAAAEGEEAAAEGEASE